MITAPETAYTHFKRDVAAMLPVRLDDYKQAQMERRIRDLARKHGADDLPCFARMLRSDRALQRELEQHITINVSEFYRNPEAFDYLAGRVLPELLTARHGVHAWSAGCSYGAEPYTLAMLLHEKEPTLTHTILATDIDRAILDRARLGRDYVAEDLRALPQRLRDRYVHASGTFYSVAPELTSLVRFERLDVLRDTVKGRYDLIACRNVVIYFTDEAKNRLYRAFVAALRPGGYLFVGATEVVGGATGLGLRYVAPCFYRKAG